MQPTLENSKYPVFEANQVLTNRHLNQGFNYLDEQERLTRANLIGIGIVCGLEVSLAGTTAAPVVRISKGCGITSQGYLIVEPTGVELEAYRAYRPPAEVAYPLLEDNNNPPTDWVWEMFPEGEPNTTLFSATPGFLDDKVVLLFLELKRENLRNCSPANCDDRGAEVTTTLRRLLVGKNDPRITRLIDGTVKDSMTIAELETSILAKLNLPDHRLPRYDVPAGLLNSSNAVLAGFLSVFRLSQLATKTGAALTSAYNAFAPLLEKIYPTNPFAGFNNLYGFLNSAPLNTTQVRFLQYYYDLFDDLLKAYDEFRWKGAELMCGCCPPEALFPRHLVLWLAHPELDTGFAAYRHYFRASWSVNNCETLAEEVVTLFRRLVEMTRRFTNAPPLLYLRMAAGSAVSYIRITPSKLGDVPLSEKCIPYYYLQDGAPKLVQLWNAEKKRRIRAHHNLSYRSYEYDVPNIPEFVADPLRFDLEPNNFLRIEGHLGIHYRTALTTLLQLRDQYRLPIDVIALRTGAFDENTPIDLSQEECRFRDLETLYDSTREEWLSHLCRELTALYGVESTSVPPTSPNPDRVFFVSKYPFIKKYASDFKVDPHKVGGHYEMGLSPGGLPSHLRVHSGQPNYDPLFYQLFDVILELADALPQDLTGFNYATFEDLYATFQNVANTLEQEWEKDPAELDKMEATSVILTWEETDDRLEDLLFQCRPDAFKTINDEYVRRIREVKQKQYFSNFLLQHPGIQHKAGVPLGGTFILVYHDDPEITNPFPNTGVGSATANDQDFALPFPPEYAEYDDNYASKTGKPPIITKEVEEAFKNIQLNPKVSLDKDVRTLIGAFTNQFIDLHANYDIFLHDNANRIIAQAVNELTDGTVIADFFLPYLCCSDCAGVQYVLPPVQPSFTYNILCTNDNDQAEVNIMPHGGAPPYSYKVGDQAYRQLLGPAVLSKGSHTLTLLDANGVESAPQTIEIIGKIVLSEPEYKCDEEGKKYIASFTVSGGTAPYTPSSGKIDSSNKFTSDPIDNGKGALIVITDANGCTDEANLHKTCPLPLDFNLIPGCAIAADKKAPVTLTITGGKSPYTYSTDNGVSSKAIPDSLRLPAGNNTVIVKDADGVKKTKSIFIPDPLLANFVYDCNPQFTHYRAKITISGGQKPYFVDGKELDGNIYTTDWIANGGKVSLKITDKTPCEVVLPLVSTCRVEKPKVHVNIGATKSDNTADLLVAVEGGKFPYSYRVNGGEFLPLNGPVKLKAGEYTIEIRDADGIISEPSAVKVPHAVVTPPPCEKPCTGISHNFSYRSWIQPGQPFESYKPGAVEFTFTDDKRKTHSVTGLSVEATPESLNKDFHGTMKTMIARINEKVAQALGAGRLTLSYNFSDGDPFARLWIEYFDCEMFSMRFSYTYMQGGALRDYEVRYMKAEKANAAVFSNLQMDVVPIQIPAFDCSVRDQCKGTPPVKVCTEKLPQISFGKAPSGDQVILTANTSGIGMSSISHWIWDVPGSTEMFYSGNQVVVKVPNLAKTGTTIKLTGITRQGCFITAFDKIIPLVK